jgi:hypothetical protein
MAPFLTSRLRTRLLILSLIGVLPALGVIVYTQSVERSQARERTLDDNLRLTRLAARQPASIVQGAQYCSRPSPNSRRSPAMLVRAVSCCATSCAITGLHEPLRRGSSRLGGVFQPIRRATSALDRPWFQRAMHTT